MIQGSEKFLPGLTELSSHIACGWGDYDGAERQLLKIIPTSATGEVGISYAQNCAKYHYAHVLLNRHQDERAIVLLDEVRQTSTYDLQARNEYIRQIATQHLANKYIQQGLVDKALALYGGFSEGYAALGSQGPLLARSFADLIAELEIAGHFDVSQQLRGQFPEYAKFLPDKFVVKGRQCCILSSTGLFEANAWS